MKMVVFEGSSRTGKSTAIRGIMEKGERRESKSIPNCFQPIRPLARLLWWPLQLIVYLVGHLCIWLKCKCSNNDYLCDRWLYTTIIRLWYARNKTVEQTAGTILKIWFKPDIVIVIVSDAKSVKDRNDTTVKKEWNHDFYIFENQVYKILNERLDWFHEVVNDGSIDDLILNVKRLFGETQ